MMVFLLFPDHNIARPSDREAREGIGVRAVGVSVGEGGGGQDGEAL